MNCASTRGRRPYLRTAEEKAEGRVPSWPRFVAERPETIDAKLSMLVFCWMVAGSTGWDALRAPDVAGLESLTGFAYMPSTLAKFVSALAISGAAQPLLAPRLVDLVERAERVFETDVQRAVVIDAEGCTFDLLATFAKAQRVLITPLKPSRVPELELMYTRGSYYRPYREHDELRIVVSSDTAMHRCSRRASSCSVTSTS